MSELVILERVGAEEDGVGRGGVGDPTAVQQHQSVQREAGQGRRHSASEGLAAAPRPRSTAWGSRPAPSRPTDLVAAPVHQARGWYTPCLAKGRCGAGRGVAYWVPRADWYQRVRGLTCLTGSTRSPWPGGAIHATTETDKRPGEKIRRFCVFSTSGSRIVSYGQQARGQRVLAVAAPGGTARRPTDVGDETGNRSMESLVDLFSLLPPHQPGRAGPCPVDVPSFPAKAKRRQRSDDFLQGRLRRGQSGSRTRRAGTGRGR